MTAKTEPFPESAERIGAYRVVRRLATGGTSDVLLAKAEGPHGFERTVVLKVLLSHFGKDDEVAKMFAREASAYARLSHPSIVRLFDFFSVPNPSDPRKSGQLVMVLEHVDGAPLARLKSMAKAIGKELDDKASIYIATCIFDALAAAHSAVDDAQIPAPVIHRDVNPSNVLVPWDGYPKLADFGIAKVTGLGHQSVVGMIKGTYGYMAPEQVTGQEAVTPRADVYAAGIILWELLTRRRAFQRGALPEIEALRAMAEPRLPALESIRSDVDRTVREALRRALEPRAEKRKITAEEMVSVLTGVVPLDQGRERLMSLLGLVRNDARAANAQPSQAPPAMPVNPKPGEPLLPDVVIPGSPRMAPDFGPVTRQGVAPPPTQPGLGLGAPSGMMAKAPPRPSIKQPSAPKLPSSAKMPAALPTTTLSSANMAAAPAIHEPHVRELLSLPTVPAMPAVSAPPVAPPPPPQRTASKPGMPAVSAELSPKSASARLADSLPPEALEDDAEAKPRASLFDAIPDSLGSQMHAMSRPPDSPRTAAPLKDLTGGLGLRDAIDEIMKSSSRIPVATPVQGQANPAADAPPQVRETTRVPPGVAQTLIGLIPPAPPPMSSSLFPGSVDSVPPNPHDVITTPPEAVKDEYANASDDPRAEPRETTVVMEAVTPRVPPVAPPPKKALLQTLAMESRPSQQPQPTEGKTGKMPKYAEPPSGVAQAPVASAASSPEPPALGDAMNALISRPPTRHVGADARPSFPAPSSSAPPPMKKGVSVGAVAVGLVVVIALGIAGTVAFVRYQAQKDSADAGAFIAPSPSAEPVTSAVVRPVPAVDAAVAAAVMPDAAAPVLAAIDAGGPTAVSATPPPTPPAEKIPEGMGLVKTTNASPGRRIFIDGNVAGQTPETVSIKCGAHKVKLGSSGVTQDVNVPCGGDIVVGDIKP